jgi:hypothetical protein
MDVGYAQVSTMSSGKRPRTSVAIRLKAVIDPRLGPPPHHLLGERDLRTR